MYDVGKIWIYSDSDETSNATLIFTRHFLSYIESILLDNFGSNINSYICSWGVEKKKQQQIYPNGSVFPHDAGYKSISDNFVMIQSVKWIFRYYAVKMSCVGNIRDKKLSTISMITKCNIITQ